MMSQYSTGLSSVTNGSPTVTGTNTLWLANVTAGDSFTVAGDGVMYDVASVDTDTQVTLSAPYAGTTASGVVYAIGTGFTVPDSFPEMSQGDIETATIFTRAMRKIQSRFTAILAGGSGANFTAMPQVGNSPLVEPATTTQIGTVEKATTTESKDATADKFPDAAGVHAAFNQYGLGIDGSAVKVRPTDLDLVDISGFYPVEGNTINSPPDAGAGLLKVFSWEGQSTIKIQEYTELLEDKVWFRTRLQASGYTDWQEIYHTGMTPNFTAMPQVGGDPIVESGSNADGYWTRWSDGTQAAWFTYDAAFTADASIERSSGVYGSATTNNDEYKWSYPVSFLSVPSVSSQTDAIHNSANAFSATPSFAKLGIFGFNGSVTGQVVSASAIGRWK